MAPTPEQLDAGLQGLAQVFTAVGVLIAAVMAAVAAWRSGKALEKTARIEKSTNGAVDAAAAIRLALETQIKSLEERLVGAKESAADVRSALSTPTPDPLPRTGRDI